MKLEDYKISKELLEFSPQKDDIHDEKLNTKPIGFMKDAFIRFRKNKASIAASFIIIILILFAVVVPFVSKYKVKVPVADNYPTYKFALPKNGLSTALGIPFWDGCKDQSLGYGDYMKYQAIQQETGTQIIVGDVEVTEEIGIGNKVRTFYNFREDSYFKDGVEYYTITPERYYAIQDYQNRTGIQVIYPMIDLSQNGRLTDPTLVAFQTDANLWYEFKRINGVNTPVLDENGNFKNIYLKYKTKTYQNADNELIEIPADHYNSIRIEENNEKLYLYAEPKDGAFKVRLLKYNYYKFYHSEILKDDVEEPYFVFGSNEIGQDLLVCLSSGARFSLMLAVIVASVNLVVGAIIGAIEGYYGGVVDLVIERFIEILGSIPFMIVITLLKYHISGSQILLLFIAFFLTGWTSMAGRTRMQFYRFKNQEYVMAARTLGASDKRIMFKHIFPNAIGTLITSCVLVIPGVIFSETSLSYLGIINLETGNMTSVGTLLSQGNAQLFTYPHVILFPSIFISLLMLSFNLFGNGLRDAFNPSLRGTEG